MLALCSVRAYVLAAEVGLLSFAAAGVDKLRIVIDSERRERLEAEEQSAPCLRSKHVHTASVQRGGRWPNGQGTRQKKL